MESGFPDLGELKSAGRPVIGCLPLYPPEELFHGLGLNPVTLWGLGRGATARADEHIQTYACSVARRAAEFVLTRGAELDALFHYNACDTLRNMPEPLARGLARDRVRIPFFSIHIPQARLESDYAADYLRNELGRLIAQLEAEFGLEFSGPDFVSSVELFDEYRGLAAELEGRLAEGVLGFADFVALMLRVLFQSPETRIRTLAQAAGEVRTRPAGPDAARVLVSGILPPPPEVCRAMDQAGLTVAANDIAVFNRAWGWSAAPHPDPAEYYLELFRNRPPCTTLLPTAQRRIQRLVEAMDRAGARGLVFFGEKFCEYEYLEFPYLAKVLGEKGFPSLQLEFGDADAPESAATRIRAFAEMLGQ